jgi:NADH dehydrogenase/NADH:ubiquinone oxidoreductase subunit G
VKKSALRPAGREEELISIVRKLPPERVLEVIDFAQFLELKTDLAAALENESEEAVAAENAHWDALLADERSQSLLEKMADEALAEIEAGQGEPILLTEDGELGPG